MNSSLQVPTQHRRRRWSRASGSLRSASNGSASSRSSAPPPEPRVLPETNAERYLAAAERQLVTLPTPLTGWLPTPATPLDDQTQIEIAALVRQRRRKTLGIAKERVSPNLRQCEVDLNREKLEVPGDPILNFVSDDNWEKIEEWLASMAKYAYGKTLLGRGRPRHAKAVMKEFERTKKEGLQFLAREGTARSGLLTGDIWAVLEGCDSREGPILSNWVECMNRLVHGRFKRVLKGHHDFECVRDLIWVFRFYPGPRTNGNALLPQFSPEALLSWWLPPNFQPDDDETQDPDALPNYGRSQTAHGPPPFFPPEYSAASLSRRRDRATHRQVGIYQLRSYGPAANGGLLI
ncbi:hypothetical protein JCM3766R1_005392 [Sporobolomyces carnicolor]